LGAIEGLGDDLGESGAHLGPLAVADGFDEKVTQWPAVELHVAEDVEDLAAERLARLIELLQEYPIDVPLARLLGDKVPQVADLGLADPVDAPEALFEAVGVPGQVVIDHQVGALQVDAFAGGIGGDEHLHLRVVPEAFLGVHPLLTPHPAVDADHRLPTPEQGRDPLLQVVQGVPVLGK